MKAAIIANIEGVKRIEEFCRQLKSIDIMPVFCENHIPKDCENEKSEAFESLISSCDIVIALGGDGTLIHAAKQAALKNKRVLGINFGRLGYNTGLEINELHLLKALKDYYLYHTESRMMLEVSVEGKTYYCLNDAVISRGTLSRIIDISVKFDGESEINCYSDGVIIATPTGSTAYSMSAGGPVVDPSIDGILVTPICDHSLFSRPIFLNAKTVLTVSANCKKNSEVYLTIDGQTGIKLSDDSVVTIKKSKFSAQLIKIKNDSFIHIVNEKLIKKRGDVV